MKRVYFAQINNVIAEATFLPLSSAFIWEYCKTQDDIVDSWELGDILFERDSIENYIAQCKSPDVFAFSTYVWNWDITCELARAVKEKWPNCLVVFGGPQVPYKTEWLENNKDICDLVVTYAGERTFAEILRGNYTAPGIISESGYTVPKPDKIIDDIPSPYLSGLMDSLMQPNKKYSAIIETNRGCPYRCTFCDQEALYYNKIAMFDYKRVIAELDWASDRKIEFLYFADSNLGMFERDILIIKHLAKCRNEKGYPRQIDYATAKQQPERIVELGRILNQEAGIKRGVTIALQSMNPATLEAISRINIANDKLEQMVSEYNAAGIENYCELILGLPEETFDTWTDGIGKILELGSDHALTVHPLSIVPNTPFSNTEYKDRYGLQYTKTAAPAGGNTYPEDSRGEIDYVCHRANTFSTDDFVHMYFFAKGIVIPHHYHGVSQIIATYLNKEYNIPLKSFYMKLFLHSKHSSGFLNTEYNEHTSSVRRSLFDMETWGRPIPNGDGFYFQDNGATASILYNNIDKVHDEIVKVVRKTWNVDVKEVATFNKHMLDLYDNTESTAEFSKNYHSWFFDNKKLVKTKSTVTVENNTYNSISDHAKNLFWFGRKSKRCFLKGFEK
jgi:radical SAM superfamily enzyme YgiQ (UPF0313 family)